MTSAALPIQYEPPDPGTLTVNEVVDVINGLLDDCLPGEALHFLAVLNGYVQQARADNYTPQQMDDATVVRIMSILLQAPSTENDVLSLLDTLLLRPDKGEGSLMFQDLSASDAPCIALFIEFNEDEA